MRLRVATFNVENLISRNAHGASARPELKPALSLFDFAKSRDREIAEQVLALPFEDDKRMSTALAIAETRADILALQEVDNLGVLSPFFANYVHAVGDIRYGQFRLVEGNDPRGIDVALAVNATIAADKKAVSVRTHHERTFGDLGLLTPALRDFGLGADDRVFNRDCLEANIDLGDRTLTVFVAHLKSFGPVPRAREQAGLVREAEARAIRAIVMERFGEGWRDANWVVAGDLNDHRERILAGGVVEAARTNALTPLLQDFGVDPVERLPPLERWTAYYRQRTASGEIMESHSQLDYILLSPGIAAANPEPGIEIVRRGLPYAVPLDPAYPDRSIGYLSTRADRYPRIGWDRPKASDHCPVVVEIDVPLRRD
jgi:endonuclease/exonuclease/phosphatase family metal-dependent hydrolase